MDIKPYFCGFTAQNPCCESAIRWKYLNTPEFSGLSLVSLICFAELEREKIRKKETKSKTTNTP